MFSVLRLTKVYFSNLPRPKIREEIKRRACALESRMRSEIPQYLAPNLSSNSSVKHGENVISVFNKSITSITVFREWRLYKITTLMFAEMF